MEFKEALKEINKEETPIVTWEDCAVELEKIISTRNDEYAESFRKARIQEAQIMLQEYVKGNPQKENEDLEAYKKRVNDFVTDYINQAPDEFARNLRTYCHMGTALWNQLARMVAEFNDFKEVYMAVNEIKIQEYAERHKQEIIDQQKAMAQAKINQERHERAIANKEKLKKK